MTGCSRCPHCTEVIVNWMDKRGYATGHGDTVEDLLREIDGHAEIAALKVERDGLRMGLKGLVDRLDYVHADPAYRSVWTVNQLHTGPYTGPTYVVDLEKARHIVDEQSTPTNKEG